MSKVNYKPEGYHSVSPYLHVNGAEKIIAFMKQAFDAKEAAIYHRPDGTVSHGSVQIGDSMIDLADGGDHWPAMPCALRLFVPDVDATYKRALQAGATSIGEPSDRFYGERGAELRDICGNNWYIATQTEVLSKEEIEKRVAAMSSKQS